MLRAIVSASCLCLCLCLVASAGCKKRQDGLPPATEWQTAAGPGASSAAPSMKPPRGMGRSSSNPHAGLDMGGDPSNPHAGLDMGGDPHAGLDMSQNPHGGGGMDVTQLGLQSPDPNRPIDPTHRITGVVAVDAKVKAHAKPGTAVFLIVKRAGATGAPVGSPLAVDKLTWSGDSVAFELTDAQAMIAGTDLTGDVFVSARYDQDADAISKQPGDLTGQVRVKVPADGVKLMLDTVLP